MSNMRGCARFRIRGSAELSTPFAVCTTWDTFAHGTAGLSSLSSVRRRDLAILEQMLVDERMQVVDALLDPAERRSPTRALRSRR